MVIRSHKNRKWNGQKKNLLIYWCLVPTLAVFQLYRGMPKEKGQTMIYKTLYRKQ